MKPKITEAQMTLDRQALEWAWRLHRTPTPDPETLAAFGEWMSVPAHADAFAVCEALEQSVQTLDAGVDGEWVRWKHEARERAAKVDDKVQVLADWHEAIHAHQFRHRQPEPARRWPAALAAMLALAVVGSAILGLQLRQAPPRIEYSTEHNTREVVLPDGTRATLDVATRLTYEASRRARVLQLESGRVYLSVARESTGREFRVQTGEVRTVVLGTRFQVTHDPLRTEVVLEEGSVRMELAGSDNKEMLRPGDRVWLNKGEPGFGRDTAKPKNVLAWTRGRLLFADTPLVEAVSEVNRYAKGARLVLADPSLTDLQISGSFVAGDAELAAAAWAATLPLKAEHQGDRILLKK